MKFAVAAIVLAGAVATNAQVAPALIIDPIVDTPWPVGSTQYITWENAMWTAANPISVFLDSGSSSDYLMVTPALIQSLAPSPSQVQITVPNLPAGTYGLQFGFAPNVSYGGPVVISGGTTGAATTTAATIAASGSAVSAASSVAASSSVAVVVSSSSAAPSSSPAPSSSSSSVPVANATSSTPAPAATTKSSGASYLAPVFIAAIVPAVIALFL